MEICRIFTRSEMARMETHFILPVFCIYGIWAFGESPHGGEVTIVPLSIYTCEGTESLSSYNIELRNVDDDKRVVDVDITFDDDFTEGWQFETKIDKWSNGNWDENFYNDAGSCCALLEKFIPKIFAKIKNSFSPRMEGKCHAESGQYILKGFEVSKDDYKLPATVLGRFRYTGKLSDESGTLVWCLVVEVEVNKNM